MGCPNQPNKEDSIDILQNIINLEAMRKKKKKATHMH